MTPREIAEFVRGDGKDAQRQALADSILEHFSSPVCSGCGLEFDPDCCWCGTALDQHGGDEGHSFVPMGCECGKDPADRDWQKTVNGLRARMRIMQQVIFMAGPMRDSHEGCVTSPPCGACFRCTFDQAVDDYRRIAESPLET